MRLIEASTLIATAYAFQTQVSRRHGASVSSSGAVSTDMHSPIASNQV